jgi:MFS family permease
MRNRLKESGWTEDEIGFLNDRYPRSGERKSVILAAMLLLLVALFAVPYSYGLAGAIFTSNTFFLTLALIGLALGSMFGLLLVDLDRLEKKHHVGLLVAIPLLSTVAGLQLFSIAQATAPFGVSTHNAIIAAFVYVGSFTLPYALLVIREWNFRLGR